MRKPLPLFLAMAVLAGCAADATKPVPEPAPKPAARAPAEAALAMVNGVAVPQSHMEFLLRQQISRGAPDNAQTRAMVKEELINRELIVQEARRTGLADATEVRTQAELASRDALITAYVRERLRKQPITEAEIQQEYERVRAQMGDKEYRARHILTDSDEQAKALIAQLDKGARFEELATRHSLDPGSKQRGGDLEWNVPQVFDRTFAEAMMKLEKGRYTKEPVRTRFGFHVIRLDDVRVTRFPSLAEVRQRIQQQLTQHRIDEAVRELRAKAKVE
jgi:peptidyl-prolyl cis-trans isomerase C